MTKLIYIHVGAGKTGTSAIQRFVFANQARLKDSGLNVPEDGAVKTNDTIAHHRLSEWGTYADYDSRREWRNIAKIDDGPVLVTSENFHSRISRRGGKKFFEEIRDIFAAWQVKVIFYIRRQDQWLQSAYEQWIKSGTLRTGQKISDFVESYANNLPDQLFEFSNIFLKENVIVRPYERDQLYKNDVIHDFFRILGMELDDSYVFPEGNANPRLMQDALEFKRIFNSVCEDVGETRLVLSDLMKYSRMVEKADTDTHYHRHALISSELRERILTQYNDAYRKIATEFLERKDETLFYDKDRSSSPRNEIQDDAKTEMENMIRVESFLLRRIYQRLRNIEKKQAELVRAISQKT